MISAPRLTSAHNGAIEPTLVIGAGFIGSHLAAFLRATGVPTVVLTRSPLRDAKAAQLAGCRIILGDALDPLVVDSALSGIRHCVYCAGGLLPAHANFDPALDLELTVPPLLNVLERLRRRPQTSLTFLSSGGTVYGQPQESLISEGHPTNPISSYGANRLAAEKHIATFRVSCGLQARVLRCSNVYGPGQPHNRRQGAVAVFLRHALKGIPIQVFGDASTTRDFLYVEDLSLIVASLLRIDHFDVINVGSGAGTSMRELINLIEGIIGHRLEIEGAPARVFDVVSSVLDNSKLRSLVDFRATPLEIGVRRTWDHMQSTCPAPRGTQNYSSLPAN